MVCHETRNKNVQFNRERGEESAWEYVRSIMRYSSPLIRSLAVIDYVHKLFVYMCAACVCAITLIFHFFALCVFILVFYVHVCACT